ncbi:HMG box-containing protein 4 [Operophtera brumata]|uniref:HMG box-containing protein 4 n=1 Tax=Operophtera brumata TaxID=104452 RepID=A0A0L7KUW0_OPEBR|nr:HMG box-containing protein 4 [Operophtera brumata]
MQEDLEVTGISRSGRVRKKSSKLMDFESPDDIETRYRRQTPVKSYANFRQDEQPDFSVPEPQRQVHLQVPVEDTPGTASGSESDYYENNAENAESMESDGSQSSDWADDGPARQTPANSLYMMEKSAKKKLVVKDGRIVARVKAQRKDKALRVEAAGGFRVSGCGAIEVAAHLRLLGESLAIIGERLKEHEFRRVPRVWLRRHRGGRSPAPAGGKPRHHRRAAEGARGINETPTVCRALPAIAPPAALLQDTLHNIAYIMPGL